MSREAYDLIILVRNIVDDLSTWLAVVSATVYS